MEDTKPNIGKQIARNTVFSVFLYFPILYANYIVYHLFTERTQFMPFISM